MPALAVPDSHILAPHRGQARWPFDIIWGAPDAASLEECIVACPMGMIDLVSLQVATRIDSADPAAVNELGGMAAVFDGVNDQYQFAAGAAVDRNAAYTILWESQISQFTDTSPTVVCFVSAAGASIRLTYNSGSASDIFLADGATPIGRWALPSGVGMFDRHVGLISNTPGVGVFGWINGLDLTDNGSVSPASVGSTRRIGGTSSASNDFCGTIRQVRRYSRAMDQADAVRLASPSGLDALYRRTDLIARPYSVLRLISASGGGSSSGDATPSVGVGLEADGFAVAGGSADLSSSIPPTMVQDSRYTVRAPIRDYRVAMPQRNRAS